MKRIAVLADIHSNWFAFQKVLEELKKEEIDKYYFLGDYIFDGFDSNKVLDKIKQLNANVVYGNKEELLIKECEKNIENFRTMDRYQSIIYTYDGLTKDNLEYIKHMKRYEIIEEQGLRICLSHASPYSTKFPIKEEEELFTIFDKEIQDFNCDVYLFGHSHIQFFEQYKGKHFINPGSVGMPIADGKKFEYGILELNQGKLNYQQREIYYDYEEIKQYRLSKDYHKKVREWEALSLCNLKYGKNYTQDFIDYLNEVAIEKEMDITCYTPNWLYQEVYQKFTERHKEVREEEYYEK